MKFLKFSSLVRFVFTGGFALAIAYMLYYCILRNTESSCCDAITDKAVLDSLKSIGGIGITITIAVMYFVGVIFFGLRMSLSRSKMLSKFYDRISLGWRKMLCPYIELDVTHLCDELKENCREGRHIPDWIYMVKRPSELLDCVVEYMFKGAGEDADDEMRYMNETATTLIFILYFAILLPLVRLITALIQSLIGKDLAPELTNILISLTVLIGLILILSVIAKTFAIKFLMKLGHMENVCKGVKDISKLPFSSNEYPTAFVLIRTTRKEDNSKKQEQQETGATEEEKDKDKYKYLENALRSVAMQDYPNVRVIILDDVESTNSSGTNNQEIMTIINTIKDKNNFGEKWEKLISYNQEKCDGPAGAAYRIRELFLMVAKERDIAIVLDDDDTLRHDGAISDIVLHICMHQADICLCSFETTENMHLNICNNGGKTHNEIVKKLEEKAEVFDTSMVMISSIGWTKAYTKKLVEKYNNNILGTQLQIVQDAGDKEKKKIKTKKASSIYWELKRYEDFPDILVLASSNKEGASPRITGVSIPTHNYSKHTGGITTNYEIVDFQEARPQFLTLTLKLAFAAEGNKIDTWSISNENVQNVVRYVLFKTIQISNIMLSHRRRYEEGQNEKWSKFGEVTRNSFVDNLCEKLERMTVKEQKELKKNLKSFIGEYIYITPEGYEAQILLPNNLKELMRTALGIFYKRNREDIDIQDLKWYIEKHSEE